MTEQLGGLLMVPAATREVDGIYDLTFSSKTLTKYTSITHESGILVLSEDEWFNGASAGRVRPGDGLSISVDRFQAVIDGSVIVNKSATELPLSPVIGTGFRIDTIVIRRDYVARRADLIVLEGELNQIQEDVNVNTEHLGIYDLIMAQVRIDANALTILPGNIEDMRFELSVRVSEQVFERFNHQLLDFQDQIADTNQKIYDFRQEMDDAERVIDRVQDGTTVYTLWNSGYAEITGSTEGRVAAANIAVPVELPLEMRDIDYHLMTSMSGTLLTSHTTRGIINSTTSVSCVTNVAHGVGHWVSWQVRGYTQLTIPNRAPDYEITTPGEFTFDLPAGQYIFVISGGGGGGGAGAHHNQSLDYVNPGYRAQEIARRTNLSNPTTIEGFIGHGGGGASAIAYTGDERAPGVGGEEYGQNGTHSRGTDRSTGGTRYGRDASGGGGGGRTLVRTGASTHIARGGNGGSARGSGGRTGTRLGVGGQGGGGSTFNGTGALGGEPARSNSGTSNRVQAQNGQPGYVKIYRL